MSDDNVPDFIGPPMSTERKLFEGERVRQLRSAAQLLDENKAEAEKRECDRAMEEFQARAHRQIQAFAELPCRGSREFITSCSTMFSMTCPEQAAPSCPRNIVKWEERQLRDDRLQRCHDGGVPKDALDTLQNGVFLQNEASIAIDEFLSSQLRMLILSSGLGVGKTTAGGYVIWRAGGLFASCKELAELERRDLAAMLKRLRGTGLVVLDDVGAGNMAPWFPAIIAGLLEDMYDKKRRVVVTTNLDPKEFASFAGPRLVDRIAGGGKFVVLAGTSLRRARR